MPPKRRSTNRPGRRARFSASTFPMALLAGLAGAIALAVMMIVFLLNLIR
jgi:hypothetical protein